MTFWKRQNYGNRKKISGCQELGGGKGWRGGTWRILGQWNYSIWHYSGEHVSLYIFPNPQNVQDQEWTLMSTMDSGWWWCVHAGLSFVTKVPFQGDVDSGGGVHVWGKGVHGKSMLLSPQFCCKPKTTLKNILKIKNLKMH